MVQDTRERTAAGSDIARSEAELDVLADALQNDDWAVAKRSLAALRNALLNVNPAHRGPLLVRAQSLVERARAQALEERQSVANRCAVLKLGRTATARYRVCIRIIVLYGRFRPITAQFYLSWICDRRHNASSARWLCCPRHVM